MVLFLAAGCSGPKPEFYWYYPGKTLKEAKTDYAECECKAQEEAAKVVEDEYFDRLRSPTALANERGNAGQEGQIRRSFRAGQGRLGRALQTESLRRLHAGPRLCEAPTRAGFASESQDQGTPPGSHRRQQVPVAVSVSPARLHLLRAGATAGRAALDTSPLATILSGTPACSVCASFVGAVRSLCHCERSEAISPPGIEIASSLRSSQ